MIYGIEQSTGLLYTEEEYWDFYRHALPDRGVIGVCWDKLPKVDVDGGDIEKIKARMYFIYGPSASPEVGTLIIDSPTSSEVWVVHHVSMADIWVESCNKRGYMKKWEGPFVTIAGTSLVDKMRISQIQYNIAMNHGNALQHNNQEDPDIL